MAVRHFTELIAWQLADQLETEVIELVRSSSADRDFGYRDQLLEALSSVPSNLAEGFTRKAPREECRFFDIALGSLSETQTQLRGGVKRKHFTPAQIAPLLQLAHRVFRAAVSYKRHQLRYLQENMPSRRSGNRPSGPRPRGSQQRGK